MDAGHQFNADQGSRIGAHAFPVRDGTVTLDTNSDHGPRANIDVDLHLHNDGDARTDPDDNSEPIPTWCRGSSVASRPSGFGPRPALSSPAGWEARANSTCPKKKIDALLAVASAAWRQFPARGKRGAVLAPRVAGIVPPACGQSKACAAVPSLPASSASKRESRMPRSSPYSLPQARFFP